MTIKTILYESVVDLKKAEERITREIGARRGDGKHVGELEINLAAIHRRSRENLPPDRLTRVLEGREMDWFG